MNEREREIDRRRKAAKIARLAARRLSIAVSLLGQEPVFILLRGVGISLPRRCERCGHWRDSGEFAQRNRYCTACRVPPTKRAAVAPLVSAESVKAMAALRRQKLILEERLVALLNEIRAVNRLVGRSPTAAHSHTGLAERVRKAIDRKEPT